MNEVIEEYDWEILGKNERGLYNAVGFDDGTQFFMFLMCRYNKNRESCVRVTSEEVELGRRVARVARQSWQESSFDS